MYGNSSVDLVHIQLADQWRIELSWSAITLRATGGVIPISAKIDVTNGALKVSWTAITSG